MREGIRMKGQMLSYDAIGGVLVFGIAIMILMFFWSSSYSSYTDYSYSLMREANRDIDNLINQHTGDLCEDNKINLKDVGVYLPYRITVDGTTYGNGQGGENVTAERVILCGEEVKRVSLTLYRE